MAWELPQVQTIYGCTCKVTVIAISYSTMSIPD